MINLSDNLEKVIFTEKFQAAHEYDLKNAFRGLLDGPPELAPRPPI